MDRHLRVSNLPLLIRAALHPPRALESHPVRADPVCVRSLSPSTTRHNLHVARRCFDHPCSDVERRQSTGHLRTAAAAAAAAMNRFLLSVGTDDVLADRFRALHRVGAGGDSSSSSSLHLRRLVRAQGGWSSVPMHGKTRLLRHHRRRRRSRAVVVLSEHARRRDEGRVLRQWDEHCSRRRRRRRSRPLLLLLLSLLLLLLFEFLLPLLGSKTLHRIQPSLLHLIGRRHTCVRVRVRPYARSLGLGSDGGLLLIRHRRVVRGRKFLLHTDRPTEDDAAHERQ